MPGGIQRVGAVEHPQVVGLAPHHHLPANAQGQRQLGKLDVGEDLAKRTLKAQGVSRFVRQVGQFAVPTGPTAIGKHVLAWTRLKIVHAVVHAPVQADEMSVVYARQGETTERPAVFDPVILHARAYNVALLNDRPFVRLRVPEYLLGLQITGQRKITIGEVRPGEGKGQGQGQHAQRNEKTARP